MQTTQQHAPSNHIHHHGVRVSTPQLRASLKLSEYFEGLDHDVQRYDLMILVKRAGKAAGFTPCLIQLLDYYMSFTRDCDWEEGSNPIIFQSLSKTSMDLGICERQVQRMEHSLCELGALTWCDSGNHRRYGQRDPKTGELLYAYGVDLTPLAALREPLQNFLTQKAVNDKHWRNTKRKISWYRSQILSRLAAITEIHGRTLELNALQSRYEPISGALRTGTPISTLTNLLDAHMDLYGDIQPMFNSLKTCGMTTKESPKDDIYVAPILDTKQLQLDKSNGSPSDRVLQESEKACSVPKRPKLNQAEHSTKQKEGSERGEAEIILETGLQHITLKQALNAASEQLR